MAKKKTTKRSDKLNYKGYIISILAVIIVIAVLYFVVREVGMPSDGEVAAMVNDEKITVQELNQKYERLPEQYKMVITKDLLLDQLINAKLLVQEAKTKGIEVSNDEIEAEIYNLKMQSFNSDYEFQEFLKENNLKIEDIEKQIYDQIMINKLLGQEILSKIDVSESRVRAFYEENKELFGNASYDEIKEQVNQTMLGDLSNNAIQVYLTQLSGKAEIIRKEEGILTEDEEVVEEEIATEKGIKTFTDTKDEICMEDNKPVVRFYTTSDCEPCDWVKDSFYSAVKDYHMEGKITVYHWELDTGDNLITAGIEEGIPNKELETFRKYNPKSTVPTYVLGCRYVRSGNGYDDLEQEKEEFKAVVERLLEI